MNTAKIALAAITLLGALSVQAVEYTQLQAEKSNIAFAYQQMGVKMDGRFKKLTATLAFDPAKPANAKAAFEVDLASIDTGGAESDQEVASKAWLNSKVFPTARFVASSVKALGGNRYEVAGQLSIKGKTQDVLFPATFSAQGKSAAFDGTLTIRRGDFAIGEGSWAKFDIVANDVQIKFHIAATGK